MSQTRLWGLGESHNGSTLVVADFGGQAVYILNPDNPASAKRFAMPLDVPGLPTDIAPCGVVVTDAGIVYIAASDNDGTGSPAFLSLDPATGKFAYPASAIGVPISTGGVEDELDRVVLNFDDSRVYTYVQGVTYWLDIPNNYVNLWPANFTPNLSTEIAISGDGNTLQIGGYFTDQAPNPETAPVYVDWETWVPLGVYGQKLNQDGSILFHPLTDGVDLMARNTGRLLYRIQVPFTLPLVYDSLVMTDKNNSLAMITTTGVSFIDLSSLPIPVEDTTPFPNAKKNRTGYTFVTRPSAPRKLKRSIPSASATAPPRLSVTQEPKQQNAHHW